MNKPRIAITLRVTEATNYIEKRDTLSQDWAKISEKLGIIPILVPNGLSDIQGFLEEVKIDGVILSGGDNIGDDPTRDHTENEIIDYGIKNRLPIFGVCRGMQVLNNYFNGTIEKSNTTYHLRIPHHIQITKDDFSNLIHVDKIKVNSFHNNIITKKNMGKNLEAFAVCEQDNTIEGFYHENFPIIGVMWHPERDPNEINQNLIKNTLLKKKFWK